MAFKIKCGDCGYKNNSIDDLVCQMCGSKLDPANRWNDTGRGRGGGPPMGADHTLGVKRSVARGAAQAGKPIYHTTLRESIRETQISSSAIGGRSMKFASGFLIASGKDKNAQSLC